MAYRIVFSDVDGTLLSSRLEILPGTLSAIRGLRSRGVPFVITSGRPLAAIDPILRRYALSCPVIACGGSLVRDADGRILHSVGFPRADAVRIVRHIEKNALPCAWCVYAGEDWLVDTRADPRVRHEEWEVEAESREGRPEDLPAGTPVSKMLCICDPGTVEAVEARLSAAFPGISFFKSSSILLEVMPKGVTKRTGMEAVCARYGISLSESVAFGDNFNDTDMLEAAGLPFLMGNAPEAMKRRFPNHTADCDSEGIALALGKIGMV